jgi:N-acylglucosamine 2-epimerase
MREAVDRANLARESDVYLHELLHFVVPFWLKHGRDRECGGYYVCLRRDGTPYDLDKVSTWSLGRVSWAFAYLYNNLRPDPEWLTMALQGIDFMYRYGFDPSGRMYGALSRDGKPLAGPFDIYHDLFAAQASAECFRATADPSLLSTAKRLLFAIDHLLDKPEANPFRLYFPAERQISAHPEHLILLETAQMMRGLDEDPAYDRIAGKAIEHILGLHYSEEAGAVLEYADVRGMHLPPWMGRWACPGHMFELSWMLVREGDYRGRPELVEKGLKVADWAMRLGWNRELGGIANDVNLDGEVCVGMKLFPNGPLVLWWQMQEALYTNLLAYFVSGEQRFLERYEVARDYTFARFPDHEYGEWYGVFSPEGKLLDGGAKGTDIKSCQHTVRTLYNCYDLLARHAAREAGHPLSRREV